MKTKKLKVIDFFCGAGGFSEGLRQQGFEIVMGVDNWLPAVETHNLNHGLNDKPMDVLELSETIKKIDQIPDTDIIVGSPPCTLFSNSNNSGTADKAMGVRLIEAYFKIVAYKKNKPRSQLKAWLMENVPNSKKYIKGSYTFRDLGLADWAKTIHAKPDATALVPGNGVVLNAAEYGTPQRRERFVCGEIVGTGAFPVPKKTHGSGTQKPFVTLGDIKQRMPSPISKIKMKKKWTDPNYPNISLAGFEITDHFYDSGIYSIEWKKARYLKINHPFMGKMSFPEDENKPSRTIMATRSSTSREAIIYKSEYLERKGDGEYRIPTIREIATLMGFPYTYQFSGSERIKWRLVGNAVCPQMSSGLGEAILRGLGIKNNKKYQPNRTGLVKKIKKIQNINKYSEASFNNPPINLVQPKFRMHPFKGGNMTVTLTNFNPLKENHTKFDQWYSSVFMGTGKEFKVKVLPKNKFKDIEQIILACSVDGQSFIKNFTSKFEQVAKTYLRSELSPSNPDSGIVRLQIQKLIEDIGEFIINHQPQDKHVPIRSPLLGKKTVPTRQLYAMYALNRLVSKV